jgi:hypothetical protein
MGADGEGVVAAAVNRNLNRTDSLLVHHFDLTGNLGDTTQIDRRWIERGPAAAMNPGGAFVVVWQETNYYEGVLLVGRRFGAGAPGAPFKLSGFPTNTYFPPATSLQPSIAIDGAGAFLVVWSGEGIVGQWFDENARFATGRIKISPRGASPQTAIAANGDAIVVWERAPARRATGGIFGRRFVSD